MTAQPTPPTPALRILVVDDQELVRTAFDLLLGAQADLEVVGTAANGAQALETLETPVARSDGPSRRAIDLVLMDIRMPLMDGITALRHLRTHTNPALAATPVLVLTTFDDEEMVLAALRAGANGFLLKDASPATLLLAVRTVANGGSWLDPAVTGTVLAHLGDEPASQAAAEALPSPVWSADPSGEPADGPAGRRAPLAEPLTGRERDVLTLVCDGLSNAAIGERLHLAESTVKTHIKALLGKAGCANRVELIVHAYRSGLVPLR